MTMRPRRGARALARARGGRCAIGLAGLVLATSVSTGCRATQRPSVKVVDPALRESGQALERERRPGGYALGPYFVHDIGLRSEPPDPDGPLASQDVRRPVQQHRAGLILDAASGRSWTTSCRLQRRAPAAAEFRAVLDENGDEVAVDCLAKARGLPPWSLSTHALLSGNFVGKLHPVDEAAPPDAAGGTFEVLTRAIVFKRIPRLLPVPVIQLRHGETAVLSLIMGRPERAWVAGDLDPIEAEAALALMLTVRYLPWELAE